MFKKLVNILLIIVLTVTVLPLKQVGKMLFNNQWTEELADHADHSPEKKSQPAKWTFLAGFADADTHHGQEAMGLTHGFYYIQSLPLNPTGEIHSPPPNAVQ